jgi:hypothetical protein
MRAKHRRRQRRWHIVDRALLADELRRVIPPAQDGGQSAVARKIGINQPVLSRLLAKKRGEVSEHTVKALLKLIPPERHLNLTQALLTPEARDALDKYEIWLESEVIRFEPDPQALLKRNKSGEQASIRYRRSPERYEDRRHLFRAMFERCPTHLRRFVRMLKKRGHEGSPRVALAIFRVIEPLLQARRSGFIERRWQDMTRNDFVRFVEAGLARETLLLDRSPDVFQAQRASERREELLGLDDLHDPRAFVVVRPRMQLPQIEKDTEALLVSAETGKWQGGDAQVLVNRYDPALD